MLLAWSAVSTVGAEEISVEIPGGETMVLVWIEPGTFQMGSPAEEPRRRQDEGPLHEVEITRGFYLGKYEVTQAQWVAVMQRRPWAELGFARDVPNHPAPHISWRDAQEFVRRLNAAEGEEVYRLPSEAEWEYACRAGSSTRWSFGDDEEQLGQYAWFRANASDVQERYGHPVGTKLPNAWGLHDMHGNVTEWVQDWYESEYYSVSPTVDPLGPNMEATSTTVGGDSYRVMRGGTFLNLPQDLRSAVRNWVGSVYATGYVGVRLVRQGPRITPTAVAPESWGQVKSQGDTSP